jgi:hypothetical protein
VGNTGLTAVLHCVSGCRSPCRKFCYRSHGIVFDAHQQCSTLCEQHVDDVDVDDVHVMSRCTCPCMLHVHAHAHAHVVATSPTGGMLSQGGGLHVVDSAGVRMVSCTFHSNSALLSVSEQPPHCRPATSLPCTLTPRQRFQPFPVCEPAGINLLCFARFRAQTCTLMSAALVTPACGPHSSLSK